MLMGLALLVLSIIIWIVGSVLLVLVIVYLALRLMSVVLVMLGSISMVFLVIFRV